MILSNVLSLSNQLLNVEIVVVYCLERFVHSTKRLGIDEFVLLHQLLIIHNIVKGIKKNISNI